MTAAVTVGLPFKSRKAHRDGGAAGDDRQLPVPVKRTLTKPANLALQLKIYSS